MTNSFTSEKLSSILLNIKETVYDGNVVNLIDVDKLGSTIDPVFFNVNDVLYSVFCEYENYYDLVFYDLDSILNAENVFKSEKQITLKNIHDIYDELKKFYSFAFGYDIIEKRPDELSDLIDSFYYDVDYYFFVLKIDEINKFSKISVFFDSIINTSNNKLEFNLRFFVGDLSSINNSKEFSTFSDMFDYLNKIYILDPLGKEKHEVLDSDKNILKVLNYR